MNTVYGIVCDELGHARNGRRAWATPAAEVRSSQDPIPVDRDHDHRWVGEVIQMERAHGNLVAVAHVADDVATVPVRVGEELRHVQAPMFWSATRIGGGEAGILITSLALTAFPARVAATPVTFRAGDIALAAYRASDRTERELLRRAADAHRTRRAGDPVYVRDVDRERELDRRTRGMHPAEVMQLLEDQHYDRRPPGKLEYRPATILRVS
jgi:hypothetical protein